MSHAIARTPGVWRVLRAPTQRFWDRSASTWDERIRPERPEHLAPLAAACERLAEAPASILELGTGTGAGAMMLARRFPAARVTAVDLSPAMVEAARSNVPEELAGRVEFAVADAATLPFADEAFDVVAQLNVPAYVAEAARVLRPGGHLILASSLGSATPYYTPDATLRKVCAEHGLEPMAAEESGGGSYFLARRATDTATRVVGDATTEGVRRFYDKSSAGYNRQVAFFERLLFSGGRRWVAARATGDVLEIAAGTGRNLRHYPQGVHLTAIELSPAMLELARREAAAVGREADLRVGDAQALDFADESFDTVTCTLALCTIPDERRAIAEVHRVLRPGGRFVAMEHVRSPLRSVRAVQRLIEPLTLRFEHDHLLRDPLDHLSSAGFVVEHVERSKLGIVERVVARKLSEGDASVG